MKLSIALICAGIICAGGRTYYSKEQALQKVWGETEISSLKLSGRTFYTPSSGDDKSLVSFDTQKVKSKGQTIMLNISADGTINEILLCKFDEPVRYKASPRFYQQFIGKSLKDDLRLKGDINGVSGATLTSKSTVASVKRILTDHAQE
ncbi:MAG: FMN-binding protein [Planctomycetota bacterium]|jgi:hypothetical protein|nr:FMN-binding protein [Planctomycetota bacterium]